MHRLVGVQTATLTPSFEEGSARRWQAEKAGEIAFWATALFAAQLYLSPALWIPYLDKARPAAVLSVLGLAALLMRRVLANKPLWMGWQSALLGVYVVAALLSPMWSLAPAQSVTGSIEVAKHFLFFLAVVNCVDSPRRVRIALGLYALSAIAPGWGTFDYWRNGIGLVEGFRGRWLGVLADPNHDAMALVGAVPILLFLTVGRGHRWPVRIAAVAGIALCLTGIVVTHSRGGSIGLIFAVATYTLLATAAAGMLLLAPTTFWQRNETVALGAEDLSIEGRLEAWQVAGRIFRERPVLGVGENAFLAAWGQYAPIDSDRLFGARFVAHNLFLEVLGQLGLVGLFGIVGFIACAMWSAWKARNGELGGEARAVLAALLGYLVCQMFSGYSNSWFLFALAGFATCCQAWAPRRAPTTAAG
jgi:putative inorganic carbon (HCO3(-)) transporter